MDLPIDPWWAYFACFLIMLLGIRFVEVTPRRRRLNNVLLPIMLLASLIIVAKGLAMAIGWQDPFAGRWDQVARTVHIPKGALVIAVLSIWPYFLVVSGGGLAFAYSTMLKHNLSTQDDA